jgi:CubicO group peptidase (beta-lactamase class C family)
VLLGLMLERVSNATYADLCSAHIWQPLGMRRTFVREPGVTMRDRIATGYRTPEGVEWNPDDRRYCGEAGVYTCLNDMMLWDRNRYRNTLGRDPAAVSRYLDSSSTLHDGSRGP